MTDSHCGTMTKRIFIAILVCIFAAGCASTATTDQARSKPNIIYVMTDQLRHDAMGYSGNLQAKTPHLDQLARESLNFHNTVSVTPVCSAHRASLFTGKYTSSTGMVVNELRLNPNQQSLAHILTNNGYETAYIGKWHLYANCSRHDDTDCAYIPLGKHRLGFDGEWQAYNFHHENYKGYYFADTPKKIQYQRDFEPDGQFDLALDFIDKSEAGDKPFFMVLSVGLPHDPWVESNVPEEYLLRFKDVEFSLPPNWKDEPDEYMDRHTDPARWLDYWKAELPGMMKVYNAMVANIDDNMGRLVQKLKEKGIHDNTILVFSSDHGEMFGENGRVFKLSFYDSAARVPFLIKWPEKIQPGNTDVLLNTPDIMPTLLALVGLKNTIPEEVEGMDLSHVCLGELGQEPQAALMQGMGHTYLWKDGYEWRAVRDKHFTLARYLVDGKELFFDNINDPLQTTNLVDDEKYKKQVQRLGLFMDTKMQELNDEFKACTWYRDHWVDKNRIILKAAKGVF